MQYGVCRVQLSFKKGEKTKRKWKIFIADGQKWLFLTKMKKKFQTYFRS